MWNALGMAAIAAWALVTSLLVFGILKYFNILRTPAYKEKGGKNSKQDWRLDLQIWECEKIHFCIFTGQVWITGTTEKQLTHWFPG